MTDKDHAVAIHEAVEALHLAVGEAQKDGLRVDLDLRYAENFSGSRLYWIVHRAYRPVPWHTGPEGEEHVH